MTNTVENNKSELMEENIIYVDGNGFQYVKGDIGGGYTINWNGGYYDVDGMLLWDYCSVTEQQIVRFCKKTTEIITKQSA